jgi:hypothetical protein
MTPSTDLPLTGETVRETDAYRIKSDTECGLIAINWQQSEDQSTYKTGLSQLLELAQDYGAQTLLSDARGLEASADWNESLTWVLEEWLPQFATTSVVAAAAVYPDDSVGRYMTDEMGRAQVDSDILFACFDDPEIAISWLHDQPVN